MREIKFRVYDKQFNKWIRLDYYKDLGAITVETDGTLTLGSAFRFTDSMMIIPEEFEIQQYTGLKDKNGVEIYEGDIIELDEWGREYYGTKGHLCRKNQLVGFKHGSFMTGRYQENYKDLNSYLWILNEHSTVVGNIYDNPELLEGE